MTSAGSINEAGYVAGMNKKGFNGPKALGELVANPIDAKATSITFDITKDKVSIIDDGLGMNKKQLTNMWDAQKQNHEDEKSTGVSGFGAKPATKILGQNNPVMIYTKSDEDNYYKAVVPWDKMVLYGKYTGMIEISEMDSSEVRYFKSKLQDKSGTIIQFPYNQFIEDTIKQQFYDFKSIKESNQRLNCVFSKFTHTSMECLHYESKEPKTLERYSYFNGHTNDYYVRKQYVITIFLDSSKKLIYALSTGESYHTFKKNGRGWSLSDWLGQRSSKKIGSIEVICALRKDNDYFNYTAPSLPGASKKLHSYEREFFEEYDDEIKCDIWYPSLYRNDQYIGNIDSLPKLKPASARADGLNCLKCNLIRTSISYEVNSSQDNDMDELMGIQENKNQLNTHHIDESLRRLIEDCMTKTSGEIWDHFSKIEADEYKRKKQEKKEAKKAEDEKAAAEKAEKAAAEKAEKAAAEKAAAEKAAAEKAEKAAAEEEDGTDSDSGSETEDISDSESESDNGLELQITETATVKVNSAKEPAKEPAKEEEETFTFDGTRQKYIEYLKNTFLTKEEKKYIITN